MVDSTGLIRGNNENSQQTLLESSIRKAERQTCVADLWLTHGFLSKIVSIFMLLIKMHGIEIEENAKGAHFPR